MKAVLDGYLIPRGTGASARNVNTLSYKDLGCIPVLDGYLIPARLTSAPNKEATAGKGCHGDVGSTQPMLRHEPASFINLVESQRPSKGFSKGISSRYEGAGGVSR
jgi:hypothetical protein